MSAVDPNAARKAREQAAAGLSKWASLDRGKTAHWWLGHEGTACGLDFSQDLREADLDARACPTCTAAVIGPGERP